jgi:hypothetical protein
MCFSGLGFPAGLSHENKCVEMKLRKIGLNTEKTCVQGWDSLLACPTTYLTSSRSLTGRPASSHSTARTSTKAPRRRLVRSLSQGADQRCGIGTGTVGTVTF